MAMAPQYMTWQQGPRPQQTDNPQTGTGAGSSSDTGGFGSLLTGLVGAGADIYGSQNASQAQNTGNQNAINEFLPQQQIGMGAMQTLGDTLGTSGRPANYSNFLNMPGYQFAVDQGTRAINAQASAMGNLYTPNTLDAVGKYVAGTAMGDYNTYVSQLMGVAGFGQNANANIAQGQINKGTAQAGGYAGTAGAIGSFLGGPNASGVSGLINKGINYLGQPSGGGTSNGSDGSGVINPGGSYSDSNWGTGSSPYVNAPTGDTSQPSYPDWTSGGGWDTGFSSPG